MGIVDGSSAQEWAERVRLEVVRQLDPQTRVGGGGHGDANGAYLLRSWSGVDNGVPVLHPVYRHPWWGFATGLRRELDGEVLANHSGDRAVDLADDIVIGDVGEPLGRYADSMVPDTDEVWWWGDEPLPGDQGRRGPAPRRTPSEQAHDAGLSTTVSDDDRLRGSQATPSPCPGGRANPWPCRWVVAQDGAMAFPTLRTPT